MTAIVGCVSNAEYRSVVGNYVTWCVQNHLLLNVTKTKELVVDLRWIRTPAVSIVDIVQDYKYSGVLVDHKLDWGKTLTPSTRRARAPSFF